MCAGSRSGLWLNRARPGTRLNPLPSPPLPVCPWQELLDYGEAEPLGGFLLRRPLTRAWCGGGIALSHQRAGSSTVSAGGTAHARGAWGSERVDRRTAAGWAGASSGGLPEREGARWRKPKPTRDTSVRSELSKSLGIYSIPALGRADGRSSPTIGPPHSASLALCLAAMKTAMDGP